MAADSHIVDLEADSDIFVGVLEPLVNIVLDIRAQDVFLSPIQQVPPASTTNEELQF